MRSSEGPSFLRSLSMHHEIPADRCVGFLHSVPFTVACFKRIVLPVLALPLASKAFAQNGFRGRWGIGRTTPPTFLQRRRSADSRRCHAHSRRQARMPRGPKRSSPRSPRSRAAARHPASCPRAQFSRFVTIVACRTENESSPENTRCTDLPSALIHFVGRLLLSPGPTSHAAV